VPHLEIRWKLFSKVINH